MQVKTLVRIIAYIFVAILYYICINWFYNNPRPNHNITDHLDKSILAGGGILVCTLSWLIPLIKYLDMHWDKTINLKIDKW